VDTTNEAYAFASCTGCTAVAVSFQVVLIVGQADVVIPQNLSAAVNYECVECVAFALASQLVVSVDDALSEETRAALESLWREIALFAESIQGRPLSELTGALNNYKAEILAILDEASGSVTTPADATPTPSPSSTRAGGPSTVPSPSAPGTSPTRTPQPETSRAPEPDGEESQPAPVEEPSPPVEKPSPVATPQPTPVPTSSPTG
jgi:putative peptide zinc metalloprotease protein